MTFSSSKWTLFPGFPTWLVLFVFGTVLFLAGNMSAAPMLRNKWTVAEDAFVRSGFSAAKKNFGAEPVLELQSSSGKSVAEAYLKFDLTNLDPSFKEARLRLNISAEKPEPTIISVKSADRNWQETAITWKDKPDGLNSVGEFQVTGTAPAWYELDVTKFIQSEMTSGNRIISLALTTAETPANKITIHARESGAEKPEIVTARPIFTAKIVFQPKEKPVPIGYIADSGEIFGARGKSGLTFGWSADNIAFVKDRTNPAVDDPKPAKGPDARYMGSATMDDSSMPTPVSWEIAVPNGKYKVHLVAGDACYYDSIYAVAVEGVLAVDGIPDQNKRWIEGSAQSVEVKDGRLTVSANSKGINNKLCFLEIAELAGQ